MNVLVVNANENTPQNNTKFEEFFSHVKNILKKFKEKSGIDRIEFIVKDYNSIDDYLYYAEGFHFTHYSNPKNKRNFEKVDLVFFDGGEKYLPWKKHGYKFQFLFKMCHASHKPLFAAGLGIQILLFFLATNFQTELNIINSNGEIQSIEEINSIPKNFLENLKKNDFFLDYVTGDIYEYRGAHKEWIPIMNIGMHKKRVAEKYMYRGKYVLNPNTNRVKSAGSGNHVLSINTENKICAQKQFYSHWLLKDIPYEFVAASNLTWFSHNFSLKSIDLQHKTICVSNNGSMVLEHEETVAVAFNITKKYPHSIKVLENYIEKFFHEAQENIYLGKGAKLKNLEASLEANSEIFLKKMKSMMISRANMNKDYKNQITNFNTKSPLKSRGDKQIQSSPVRPTTSYLANTSRPYSTIKKVKHFGSHVGLGFSKREMVFVENNAVNERPISSSNFKSNALKAQPENIDNPFSFYLNSVKNKNKINEINNISGGINSIINQENIYKIKDVEIKNNSSNKNNLFGEGSNLYYNGDIKSVKLTGSPSENNRIAKIFNIQDNSLSPDGPFKSFSTLEEIKKNINNDMSIKEGYLNFVPKDKMNDDQIIEYYKKMRRRITQNLFDIAKHNDKKVNKLEDSSSINKINFIQNETNTKITTRNRSASNKSNIENKEINSNSINKISDKKRDDVNAFTLFFPYVKQDDYPLERERRAKYISEEDRDGSAKNNRRENVRVNLFSKYEENKNFKYLENDVDYNLGKPTVRCSSPYQTDNDLKRKYLINSKSKWISNNDFKTFFGKQTNQLKPVAPVIGRGSSLEKSGLNYKYRNVSKDKWIVKKSFKF